MLPQRGRLEFQEFYLEAQRMIDSDSGFALILLDFNNFNYVNDIFGFKTGNEVLKSFTEFFTEQLFDKEYCTRVRADYFAFLLDPANGDIPKRLLKMVEEGGRQEALMTRRYAMTSSGGAIILKKGDTIQNAFDRANFARKEAKSNGVNQFYFFDEKMGKELEWRQIVTLRAENAMANDEFVMYLQPKISMKNKEIVGAESLARWESSEFGLLLPDRFIPIMEKNGLICELDFIMLKRTCEFLRRCKETGLPLLPISVNFSKLHLYEPNFVERVKKIADENGVDHALIELEMTENIFTDELKHLVEVSGMLKQNGFRVSLDDFGKAYSSLNYLKQIPLDVIKIDKGFLNADEDKTRGRIIIAKMVELIKSLRMISVMEGVETEEQVEFLEGLGCDVAQGFFYARPMPENEYETLLLDRKLRFTEEAEEVGWATSEEMKFDSKELYMIGKNLGIGLIKGVMGENLASIQYINDCALGYFGFTREEIRDKFHNNLLEMTLEEDRETANDRVKKLLNGAGGINYTTRILNKDGDIVMIEGRSSCVRDTDGKLIGLHAFRNVTEEVVRSEKYKKQSEARISELEAQNDRYKNMLDLSNDILFDWSFKNDTIVFSDKKERFFTKNWKRHNFSVNLEARKRIHPADLKEFEDWVANVYKKSGEAEAEFRVKSFRGEYVWMKARSVGIGQDGKADRAIGVFIDIDKQKHELDYLIEKSQIDPLTRLLNKEETRARIENWIIKNSEKRAAFVILDIDNFKGVNDNLGHQFGDSVLRELSRRIVTLQNSNDVVGRLGGDEIVIFLENLNDEAEASAKVDNILNKLHGTYFGISVKYDISVSGGISMFPKDGGTFDDLYRFADIALYASKRNGKNCYTFYGAELGESATIRTKLECTDRFLANYFDGDIGYNIFEQLYETKDIDTTIQMILEMIGKRYNVDRTYIFEHSADGKTTSNTYEWCAEGIESEKENLQNLDVDDLRPFLNSFNQEGILVRNDIAEMDPYSYEMLNEQGIKSLLHCAISDEGKMSGFIGFDMCRKYRQWRGDEIAILGYLSRILSVFLLKRHAIRELQDATENYSEVLNRIGELVYVVNEESRELEYFNSAGEQLGFRQGEKCYRKIFGIDEPCKNCPIEMLKEGRDSVYTEFRSERFGADMGARVSRIRWADGKEAILICCADITKFKNPAK